jgi:hypothetical protein
MMSDQARTSSLPRCARRLRGGEWYNDTSACCITRDPCTASAGGARSASGCVCAVVATCNGGAIISIPGGSRIGGIGRRGAERCYHARQEPPTAARCGMSEQGPPNVLQATVPGDWWAIAAIAMEVAYLLIGLHSDEPESPLKGRRRPQINGEGSASNAYLINVYVSEPIAEGLSELEKAAIPRGIRLGQLLINDVGEETHIAALPAAPEYRSYWALVIQRVRQVGYDARLIRRNYGKPAADDFIELYYRSHSHDKKVTLKDIAAQSPYSYDYLRKVKRRYDQAGKWGSKRNPKGSRSTV